MTIKEDELISKDLKTCEVCEWCVPTENMLRCLLKREQTGLFQHCKMYKTKTGNHISI